MKGRARREGAVSFLGLERGLATSFGGVWFYALSTRVGAVLTGVRGVGDGLSQRGRVGRGGRMDGGVERRVE